MQRKIAHIDMDAFYVSIEIRDNPKLASKPVAVGGSSDRRGVLSTCNYIARKYGVHSAMPTALALKKCPGLVVLNGRMDVYREVSQQIRKVCDNYSDVIEPLSLDEMYLDLSDSTRNRGSATLTAKQIRQHIYNQTGLTASAGIAPLKFLAKIASDINKPDGQYTVSPDKVIEFISALKLKAIPGVGKVTQDRLARLGLVTGADVRNIPRTFMLDHFGKYGGVIWDRCQGIDNREIQVSRIRKSVGVERTFDTDIHTTQELTLVLSNKLLPELKRRAEKHLKIRHVNSIGVKIKFHDFHLTTKDTKHNQLDEKIFINLLHQAFERGQGKPVRLLGLHIAFSDTEGYFKQLELPLHE